MLHSAHTAHSATIREHHCLLHYYLGSMKGQSKAVIQLGRRAADAMRAFLDLFNQVFGIPALERRATINRGTGTSVASRAILSGARGRVIMSKSWM